MTVSHRFPIQNHGEKPSLFQFQNLERIILIRLIIDLLLSQVAYVKLLKEWLMNVVWHLKKNGLLARQQCDYRANRSTGDHLVYLETFRDSLFKTNI